MRFSLKNSLERSARYSWKLLEPAPAVDPDTLLTLGTLTGPEDPAPGVIVLPPLALSYGRAAIAGLLSPSARDNRKGISDAFVKTRARLGAAKQLKCFNMNRYSDKLATKRCAFLRMERISKRFWNRWPPHTARVSSPAKVEISYEYEYNTKALNNTYAAGPL